MNDAVGLPTDFTRGKISRLAKEVFNIVVFAVLSSQKRLPINTAEGIAK